MVLFLGECVIQLESCPLLPPCGQRYSILSSQQINSDTRNHIIVALMEDNVQQVCSLNSMIKDCVCLPNSIMKATKTVPDFGH